MFYPPFFKSKRLQIDKRYSIWSSVCPSKVTPMVKQHLEAGEWDKSVFHFICILPPWLQFVVLLFFHWEGGKKVVVTFFFPWITVSVRSRLLFRIILLFLLSSGVSLAYLAALFLSGSTWGDRSLVVFCWRLWWFFLPVLWGWPVCSEPLSRTAGNLVVQEGPWSLLSVCSPLPACQRLDRTGSYTANQGLPMQTA